MIPAFDSAPYSMTAPASRPDPMYHVFRHHVLATKRPAAIVTTALSLESARDLARLNSQDLRRRDLLSGVTAYTIRNADTGKRVATIKVSS